MLKFAAVLLLLHAAPELFGQVTDSTTANTLSSVEVKAYGQARRLKDVPAAVGFVGPQTFNHFGTSSVVQAVNTVAGVRMEERSPGSYRFNIRGSSLRSPFGVRNVKVYFNDIPITDPGGNTFLNNLGAYNFASLEILKGPGSSLYGASTGGVLLIESVSPNERNQLTGEYSIGSFGLHNAYAAVTTGSDQARNKLSFQHQQSDGYRRHSALRRDVLSWTGSYRLGENQQLKTTFLYSDLFYETPGALTLAEYNADPRASRPAGGGFPGAEQNQASIRQRSVVAGASLLQQLTGAISNQTIAYAAFTELRNPTIRNYGKATEPHVGGRSVFTGRKQWTDTRLEVMLGAELQQGFSTSAVYKNVAGQPDSLQTDDEIRIRQSFVFLQANLSFKNWDLTAGTSINRSKLALRSIFPSPGRQQNRTLNDELTPRLAIARRFTNLTVYSSVSRGFSPPTATEILPSGSALNLSLQAEEGTNYDLGFRGSIAGNFTFDVNAFYFRLKNTIVQRRDPGGGDFFINAGRTSQKGIETALQYNLWQNTPFLRLASVWLNHTYHHFRYREFKPLANDFSGKTIPGVAPNTISSGFEAVAKNGLSLTLTHYYNSRIPLNDANTAYANAFHLVGARLGYDITIRNRHQVRLAAGADNLLNERYSLGNDVNAFGGRYFNAAAGRNFYASLLFRLFSQ